LFFLGSMAGSRVALTRRTPSTRPGVHLPCSFRPIGSSGVTILSVGRSRDNSPRRLPGSGGAHGDVQRPEAGQCWTGLSRGAQGQTGGGHGRLAHTRRAQVGVESARGLPFHVHDLHDARIARRCFPAEPGIEHDADGDADVGSDGAGLGGDHHIGADDHPAGRGRWSRRRGAARRTAGRRAGGGAARGRDARRTTRCQQGRHGGNGQDRGKVPEYTPVRPGHVSSLSLASCELGPQGI